MTLEEKLAHVRFQIKWYSNEVDKSQLAVDAHRKLETELIATIKALNTSKEAAGA